MWPAFRSSAADEVPEGDRRHAQRASEALDPVGRLPVEELQLPDVHEHLRRADQHVLRDLPEHAGGARPLPGDDPPQPRDLHRCPSAGAPSGPWGCRSACRRVGPGSGGIFRCRGGRCICRTPTCSPPGGGSFRWPCPSPPLARRTGTPSG
ncbi:hypothetical protein MIMGU_mgv1a015657mg [Erythranthe guttata]|uniref:Uncharacterized protein n=1 Tax=Erythranthe guttata TaxID=4155 RepID=A0A022PQK7_ERYGU|nr:hypothetical protein MIMGU_mgv1a015657mg [Erythranthe guttata]